MISRQHVFYFNFLFASLFCVLRHFYCYRCLVFVPACCFICQRILKRKYCFLLNMNQFLAIYKTRNTGTAKEMPETWGMEGECYVLENVLKHSPEFR